MTVTPSAARPVNPSTPALLDAPRGLAGVVVADTEVDRKSVV